MNFPGEGGAAVFEDIGLEVIRQGVQVAPASVER
jgi:hypothetical protein